MATRVLLDKTYDGESIADIDRDVYEAFDGDYTPNAKDIPMDENNIPQGVFTVCITWSPE